MPQAWCAVSPTVSLIPLDDSSVACVWSANSWHAINNPHYGKNLLWMSVLPTVLLLGPFYSFLTAHNLSSDPQEKVPWQLVLLNIGKNCSVVLHRSWGVCISHGVKQSHWLFERVCV